MSLLHFMIGPIALTAVSIAIQLLLFKSFSKIASPSAEQKTHFIHRMSWVTLSAVVFAMAMMFADRSLSAFVVIGSYVFAILNIQVGQGYFRNRVMDVKLSLKDLYLLNLRGFAFMFGIYGIYLLFSQMPTFLGIQNFAASLVVTVLSVGFAIFGTGYLTPYLFSKANKTVELNTPEMLTLVQKRVEEAGLPKLRVDVWPTKYLKVANAAIIGKVNAPDWCRGRVIISDSLLSDFSPEEVDAIVCHELAHFTENHLRKRTWFPLGIYLLAIVASIIGNLAVLALAIPVSYIFCFVFTARKIVRNQELDADWIAINRFKVDAKIYFDTLDKLVLYSGESVKKRNPLSFLSSSSAHPSTEDRRRIVNERFGEVKAPFERALFAKLRWSAGALVAVFFVASVGLKWALPVRTARSVASVEKKKAPDVDALPEDQPSRTSPDRTGD
jgi:Zn-dependent protease with chaperone function